METKMTDKQEQAPEVHAIEAVPWNGEAPFSDNFYYIDQYGFNHQITVRAVSGKELLTRVEFMTKFLYDNKRTPKAVGQQPAAPAPTNGSPPANTGATANTDTTVQDGSRGTAPLEKFVVNPDGKIEFYAQGFKWPFKDGRGEFLRHPDGSIAWLRFGGRIAARQG